GRSAGSGRRAPGRPRLRDRASVERVQLERRRPLGRRLDDDQARPIGDGLERELDLATVVLPAKRQKPPGVDGLDDGGSLLAVVPPEDAAPAGDRLELDVVREPLLEPL